MQISKAQIIELTNLFFDTKYTYTRYLMKYKLYRELYFKKWEESNCENFELYRTKDYAFMCSGCYLKFTRLQIKKLINFMKQYEVKSICEVYPGAGFSLIDLLQNFSFDKVSFFDDNNVPEQRKFLSFMSNFFMIDEDMIREYDYQLKFEMVYAFEVIEHFKEIDDIVNLLCNFSKKYVCVSTSFGFHSYGHFKDYIINEEPTEIKDCNKGMIKLFDNRSFKLKEKKSNFYVFERM